MQAQRRITQSLGVALIVFAIASCEHKEPATTSSGAQKNSEPQASDVPLSPPREEPSTKKTPRERKAIDPATTGSIQGVVEFLGTPPERKEMAVGNTAGCEKHPVPPLTEDVIVTDGHLQNVFVYIKQGLEEWIMPPPGSSAVVLAQDGCMYRPRVIGMQTGQKLSVANSDPATHNVHARSERNDGFNRSQPAGGATVEWVPTKPEVMVPVTCDIHPWMKAFIGVRDHPWFAVTGTDGRFTLQGVPPGEYVLEAWHEKYGKKTVQLTVAPKASVETKLSFSGK